MTYEDARRATFATTTMYQDARKAVFAFEQHVSRSSKVGPHSVQIKVPQL